MKNKKISINIFKSVILILFITFMIIFTSNKYGYFEYKKHQQVVLTQEQIQKFENDIKDGKNIDIQNYISKTNSSYQTKFSQMGLNLSNFLSSIVRKSMDGVFKYIDKAINESR